MSDNTKVAPSELVSSRTASSVIPVISSKVRAKECSSTMISNSSIERKYYSVVALGDTISIFITFFFNEHFISDLALSKNIRIFLEM